LTQIAFLLYPDMTALDAIGPHEVLARLPGADVRFVASTPGQITTDVGMVLTAGSALEDVPSPDIIVVPGGPGTRAALEDAAAVGWLRRAHETSRWTTSVCTGSLLLGAAGILAGKRANTHWIVRDRLAQFGAQAVAERVVVEGKVITAAGVSAGIDMALRLEAGEDEARALQLFIEYDPDPPFEYGSLEKAPPQTPPPPAPGAVPPPPPRPAPGGRGAEGEPHEQRRERERAAEQRVVQHRHLDHHPTHALRRQRGDLERGVGAQRGPHHRRLGQLEVGEQRHDLAAELGHRVAPHVGRPVRLAVPEQVERQHTVAALGQRAGERVVHVAAEQQAVEQHDDARPFAVGAVGQPAAGVGEAAVAARHAAAF
jgi:putative intracellular protease/amidase